MLPMQQDRSRAEPTTVAAAAAAAPTTDAAAVEQAARAAQIGLVFDRSRSSNLAGPPVALLVAWLLWPEGSHAAIVAWVVLKSGISAVRALLTWRFDRERADPAAALKWGRRFELLMVVEGSSYTMIGTVLLPAGDPVLAVLMVATLLGVAAIGLAVLSVHFRAALALVVPTILPSMLWQLAEGTRVSIYVGLGMAVYLGLVAVEARRASEHTLELLRLRFRMDELAAQRQQALEMAHRSNETKSRFLATMSHEMRTPLHGMLGLARLLRDTPADSRVEAPAARDSDAKATRAHHLATLERTGEHLLGIINDVLDYSRIESQHLRLQPGTLDLHALVAELAELARVSAAEKGIVVRVLQTLPAPCFVRGDAARLRQVLLNLSGNAVKFTERGSIVFRSGRNAHGELVLEVQDTGPGVPAADHERIFEPFEQLDGSYARQHGGTGLGLAISRQLVRAMGGELVCEAAPAENPPAAGSVVGGALFRMVLPLAAAPAPAAESPAEAAEAPRATPPALRRGDTAPQVLLAEDNPVNAIVARAWLERLGVVVTTVPDGEQAVAQVAGGHYDLVLMDCQMPGIDGFEATARIRAHERATGQRAIPIVALTANALQGDRERSLAAGMDEHLAKPFDETRLRAVLVRHLPGLDGQGLVA
jgi:two-component system, sensor histidine kinase